MIGLESRGKVHYFITPFYILAVCFLTGTGPLVLNADEDIRDQYPGNLLYSKPVEVIPNVWTAIGATGPPTYENTGHNNNLSFVITGNGVVVINAGAAASLAKALHQEIKQITDQPVVLVVNENGQGHAMLGNSYWYDQGVPIIAHEDAAYEFLERSAQILERMQNYNKEKAFGTRLVQPTETFSDKHSLLLNNKVIEILYLGPSHSPGDILVWLPADKLVISGDMAFHERLLPIFPETNTAEWIETWENQFEKLEATYVIPGHGHPTNMAQVRKYTRDYLVFLREKIGHFLDQGGELKDAYYVDQSPFSHLNTFDELATRNAGRVFEEMEFE